MSTFHAPKLLTANRILAALPQQQYAHLFSNLQSVYLPRSRILYELGDPISYCFFIMSGMVSLLGVTEDGSAVEISMVGNEGVVGIPAVLRVNRAPCRIEVQIPGKAMRVRTELLLSEFLRGGPIHDMLLRYTHSLISQISQSAACNRFHSTQQRLCRWLLICQDRVRSDTLHLTQEALSHMLGATRTTVTAAATDLKKAGLIHYRRGSIEIIDRPGLQMTACECYRIVTKELGYLRAA